MLIKKVRPPLMEFKFLYNVFEANKRIQNNFVNYCDDQRCLIYKIIGCIEDVLLRTLMNVAGSMPA